MPTRLAGAYCSCPPHRSGATTAKAAQPPPRIEPNWLPRHHLHPDRNATTWSTPKVAVTRAGEISRSGPVSPRSCAVAGPPVRPPRHALDKAAARGRPHRHAGAAAAGGGETVADQRSHPLPHALGGRSAPRRRSRRRPLRRGRRGGHGGGREDAALLGRRSTAAAADGGGGRPRAPVPSGADGVALAGTPHLVRAPSHAARAGLRLRGWAPRRWWSEVGAPGR